MSREINILTFIVILMTIVNADNGREDFFGNPDGIVYPGPVQSRNVQQRATPSPRMTVSLARTLSSIDSIENFLKMVKGVPEEQKNFNVESRFGVERSNVVRPSPAKCIPELKIVSLLPNDTDSRFIYFPSCTRVKRCGGCCEHSSLSCQPIEMTTENFEIQISQLDGLGDLVWKGKENVAVDIHTRCRCRCAIKNLHCHDRQIYSQDRCACECYNVDEEDKCRNNELKYWNSDSCTCHCKETTDCTAKFYFNPESCRCEAMSFYSWAANRRIGTSGRPQTSEGDLPSLEPLEIDNRRRKNKDDPEYK